MADKNTATFDGTWYHIQFTSDTVYGNFTDTLHFTEAEYQALTQEQLDTLQSERVTNWVDFVTSQSNPQ